MNEHGKKANEAGNDNGTDIENEVANDVEVEGEDEQDEIEQPPAAIRTEEFKALSNDEVEKRREEVQKRLSELRMNYVRYGGTTLLYDGTPYRREDEAEITRLMREDDALYNEQRYREWVKSEAGKLCTEFYEKFQEYRRFLQKNAGAWNKGSDFAEHQLFRTGLEMMINAERASGERQQSRLTQARRAARCEHSHENGERCGCPRLKGKKYCYMHQSIEDAKTLKVDLGPLEDPDSLQVACKRLQKAVIEESLSDRQIRRLTSLLRIATWNVTRTRFGRRAME